MLNEQTISTLQSLKLFGMARSFQERLAHPAHAELSHGEFTGLLVQDEKTDRDNRRLKRLLKKADLRVSACLEDMDYRRPRGLSRQTMIELASTQWIDAHRNILITGPTGVGKTYIACALGNFAARSGLTVRYLRAPRLFETLHMARAKGDNLKILERLAAVQLLIVDDFLLSPMTDREQRDLLELIEDRYASASTVLTSQCPVDDWYAHIGDPTLADAICDRLLHNAYKVTLMGESFRKENGGVTTATTKKEEKPSQRRSD